MTKKAKIDKTKPFSKPIAGALTKKAVLICTEHRAVLFGFTADPLDAVTVTLHDFRNCIYWTGVGGVFGLAERGPAPGCKIGTRVSGPAVFQKVTCVIEVSTLAAQKWQSFPCL